MFDGGEVLVGAVWACIAPLLTWRKTLAQNARPRLRAKAGHRTNGAGYNAGYVFKSDWVVGHQDSRQAPSGRVPFARGE